MSDQSRILPGCLVRSIPEYFQKDGGIASGSLGRLHISSWAVYRQYEIDRAIREAIHIDRQIIQCKK